MTSAEAESAATLNIPARSAAIASAKMLVLNAPPAPLTICPIMCFLLFWIDEFALHLDRGSNRDKAHRPKEVTTHRTLVGGATDNSRKLVTLTGRGIPRRVVLGNPEA